MSKENLEGNIEAILFSYGNWITTEEIKKVLKLKEEKVIEKILRKLKKKYETGYAYVLTENDLGKWKMHLKPEFENISKELVSGIEIPRAALKVLSVIAYEQPITKTRLGEILGKYVKKEVDYLFKNKFLYYDKIGIGKYYRVTKKFYEYFDIDEKDFKKKANKELNIYLKEDETIIKEIKEEPKTNLES